MDSKTTAMSFSKENISPEHNEHVEHRTSIPVDLDDPHRGALEDNPDHAEKLSWRLILAVVVSSP